MHHAVSLCTGHTGFDKQASPPDVTSSVSRDGKWWLLSEQVMLSSPRICWRWLQVRVVTNLEFTFMHVCNIAVQDSFQPFQDSPSTTYLVLGRC